LEPPYHARNDSVRNRVRLTKTDNVSPAITFYGWSLRQAAGDADPCWLIQRTSRDNAGIALSEWALEGTFTAAWSLRSTYFAAPGSGTAALVHPVSIFDLNGNPFTPTNPLNVTASFSGLRNGGKISVIPLNAASWTPVPAVPLSGRNALALQNRSGVEMKINYDNATVGYVGIVIPDGGERQYDVTDAIILYAKSAAGTPNLVIEELS